MRLIDADEAKKKINQMQTLKASEKNLLRLALDRTPTYERPPNDPLTLEQLREMDGEPVWVRELVGPQTGNWALVTVTRACGVRLLALNTNYPEDLCGVTWRAYRHKPEEGTSG